MHPHFPETAQGRRPELIISIEAIQPAHLSSLLAIEPHLNPPRCRFRIHDGRTVLPPINFDRVPNDKMAEKYHFISELLFLQALFQRCNISVLFVSSYWENFQRLFFESLPDEVDAWPAYLTWVLDFHQIQDPDAINNRLFWTTLAKGNVPQVKFLSVDDSNWREKLMEAVMPCIPPELLE